MRPDEPSDYALADADQGRHDLSYGGRDAPWYLSDAATAIAIAVNLAMATSVWGAVLNERALNRHAPCELLEAFCAVFGIIGFLFGMMCVFGGSAHMWLFHSFDWPAVILILSGLSAASPALALFVGVMMEMRF
jgi:hypothetical protein